MTSLLELQSPGFQVLFGELATLLCELFTDTSQLLRFLQSIYGSEVLNDLLDTSNSMSAYVTRALVVLRSHGLLDDKFFDQLVRARPNREAEIRRVQRGVLRTNARPERRGERVFSLAVKFGRFELVVAFGAVAYILFVFVRFVTTVVSASEVEPVSHYLPTLLILALVFALLRSVRQHWQAEEAAFRHERMLVQVLHAIQQSDASKAPASESPNA